MTTPRFTIEATGREGRAIRLSVAGRLDATTAPRLLERCHTVEAAGMDLVLDLSAVSFISSSGVGALMILSDRFHDRCQSFLLEPVSPPVRAILELLNLSASFSGGVPPAAGVR